MTEKWTNTSTMPRPGTFANQGDAMKHEHDTNEVAYIVRPADEAWTAAERLAADERLLTPEQRTARRDLLKNEATRVQVAKALFYQPARLTNAVISGKTLADRRELQRKAEFRASL